MRKILVFVMALLMFACSKKQQEYNIKVQLDGAEGKILLEEYKNGALSPIDTADVVDGVAVLKGSVEYPRELFLSVLGNRPKAILFVENSDMSVVGKADSLNKVKVTGSATHDEFQELNEQITKVGDEYMALYRESRAAMAAGDTAKSQELMNKVEELYNGIEVLQTDFVKNNPSSYVSPYILSSIQYSKEVETLDSLVNGLDPKMQSIQSIINLKERISTLKKLAVGQIAPDFTQNDPEGNPVKFSDVYSKNEITLLDFWASWCGPCRQENPNVVAVYNDFKDKGFTVFGVSLDRDKDAWLKAIKDDKLNWTQVSDLAYWQNAVAKTYAINSIPSSLLVDKTGKIIAKNKRSEELRKTVAEILK